MAVIKFKYVNAFRNRNRKNRCVRYYFRQRGCKAIPLPGLPGSDQFMAAYAAAAATDISEHALEIGAKRTVPGTINALAIAYYNSAEWHAFATETQRTRRRIIERFRLKHGEKRVALLRRDHIPKMLADASSLSARRSLLKTLRGMLRFAVPLMRKDDPTEGIAGVKLPKSKGHHTWTDDEISQYRAYWRLGTQQRLVFEFALETTSRRGEVVRLGPQHAKNGRIRIERTHGSEDVEILMSPQLQAACDAMPKAHLTYIVTAYGKPRSKYGLGNDFAKWATEAGLPSYCRLHGLKKGGMRRIAEAGGTAHELMAISGHKTLTEVQRYTKDVDRKKLADSAMAKLRRSDEAHDVTNIPRLLHKHGANPLK
jgi:hypothetical protein